MPEPDDPRQSPEPAIGMENDVWRLQRSLKGGRTRR
jgi:hypothetical protein